MRQVTLRSGPGDKRDFVMFPQSLQLSLALSCGCPHATELPGPGPETDMVYTAVQVTHWLGTSPASGGAVRCECSASHSRTLEKDRGWEVGVGLRKLLRDLENPSRWGRAIEG